MIEIEKIDCTDSLIFGLNRSTKWRQGMTAKYPSDPRNARAAECLAKLATDASKLTDEAWLELKPHCGWANERFCEAISQTARAMGFMHKIKDLPSFVKHLLDVLSQPVAA